MEKNEIKLELRHVSKRFPGVLALDNVSFSLRKGTTHVLCGENGAGKSTLMKIINGLYRPDEGEIYIDGKRVDIHTPLEARQAGIAMIYQELSYVPDLTLEENICLGYWPMKNRAFIDWGQIRKNTLRLLEQEELPYSPETKLRSLSVSDIQMIEILKAVNHNAEIIIMDEPTSAITNKEVERLFRKIEELKARGVSIIYISHKLDEIFQIADEITILRDGKMIATYPAEELNEKTVIELMVGRKIENQYVKETVEIGQEILRVEHLSSKGMFNDINFNVRQGEIVGFAGVMGAGRTEVMRAVFGMDTYDSGKIIVKGKPIRIRKVKDAVNEGIVMLTEDRRRYGIIPVLSVAENTAIAALDKFIYRGRWHKSDEEKAVKEMCDRMRVKTPSMDTQIYTLSGGNQQKIVLAKWMVREPDILILDEPTRGIDVGAKSEIYQLITELVKQGKSIIMISSELPELLGMCDRIYVMHEKCITGMLDRDSFSQEAVMELAVKSGS